MERQRTQHAIRDLVEDSIDRLDLAGGLEPDPPMDRGDYNRRGCLVAWLLRQAIRRWPTVFWNEAAHARQRVREGAEPYVVRR